MHKNEKGVVLLLALGFAALLLLLAMSFLTNSVIERKAAATSAKHSQTKLLAESALNRAVCAMRYQMQKQYNTSINAYVDPGIYRFDNIVSKSDAQLEYNPEDLYADSAWHGILDIFFYDQINEIYGKVIADNFYAYFYPLNSGFDYSFNLINPEASTQINQLRRPQWQYIKDNNGKNLGRFIYAVLPDMGKIPYIVGNRTPHHKSGSSLDELSLEKTAPYMGWIRRQFNEGKNYMPEQKFSTLSGDADTKKAQEFFSYNMLETAPMESVFNSAFCDSNEILPIFNLSKLNDELSGNDEEKVTQLLEKIPFLNRIGATEAQNKQVAANLIDYCDVSDKPTTDWNGYTATFSGNERTPYINEFGITITLSVEVFKEPIYSWMVHVKDRYTMRPKVAIVVREELFDFFDSPMSNLGVFKSSDDLSIQAVAKIAGKVEYDTTRKSSIDSDSESRGYNIPEWIDAKPYIYRTLTRTEKLPHFIQVVDADEKPDMTIAVKMTGIESLSFKYGGKEVDFVKNLGNRIASPVLDLVKLSSDASAPHSKSFAINLEALDPRCNLDGGDGNFWKNGESLGAMNGSSYYMAGNPYNPDKDYSHAETLEEVLKSYIIPAGGTTIKNVSELGRIHRGEPWRTLNISKAGGAGNKFNAPKSARVSYLEGDGGILNQVTVNTDAKPQLVDINTRSLNIWKALLSDIYENTENPKLIWEDEKLAEILPKIPQAIVDYKLFFPNRSDILRPITVLQNDLGGSGSEWKSLIELAGGFYWSDLTKAKRDQLIGTFLPLCKSEPYPEYLQIFICAQLLKENDLSSIAYNPGVDLVDSEVQCIAKVKRSGNNFQLMYIDYL